MERTLVVVDSFYDDPDEVRNVALTLDYPITGRFPGRNTLNYDIDGSLRRVVLALRGPVSVNRRNRDIAFFRLTRRCDEGTADIHVDFSQWAGVVYLNPNPPTSGGTSFFRHGPTGLTAWPSTDQVESLAATGAIPRQAIVNPQALAKYFAEQGRHRELWDEIMHVPNLYGRAVFYNARQFHTISDWRSFGDTPANARLTQLFFFDTGSVKPAGQTDGTNLTSERSANNA